MLYCLEVVQAHPDWKRPYASAQTFHFVTKEEANEKRRELKQKYYDNFLQYLEEAAEDVPDDIDKIDEDEAQSYIYFESYMDMAPFTATVYEIKHEDDHVTSKRVSFPINLID